MLEAAGTPQLQPMQPLSLARPSHNLHKHSSCNTKLSAATEMRRPISPRTPVTYPLLEASSMPAGD